MPRKTIWKQHRGRFIRHLHSDNHARKTFKRFMPAYEQERYWAMITLTGEWATIRHPHLKPLIHNGKKAR